MVQTKAHDAAQVLFDNLKEGELALVVSALHSLADTRRMVGEVARLQAVAHLDVAREPEVRAAARALIEEEEADAKVVRLAKHDAA